MAEERLIDDILKHLDSETKMGVRSEERRVGKEC